MKKHIFILMLTALWCISVSVCTNAYDGLTAEYDGNGVWLSGSINITEAVPLTIIIGKPGVTDSEINTINLVEADTKVEYVNTILSAGDGSFEKMYVSLKDNLETGECGVFLRGLGGDLYKAASFYSIGKTDIENIIKLFNEKSAEEYNKIFLGDFDSIFSPGTGAENILEKLGAQMATYNIIKNKSNFYGNLSSQRPFARDDENNIEAITALINAFNRSCALTELNESEATLSVIEKHNGKWWNVSVADGSDFASLATEAKTLLLTAIKNQTFTTPDMFEKAFATELAIQTFKSCKTRDQIIKAIEKYNEYYKLDLSLLSESKYSEYNISEIYNSMLDSCQGCTYIDDISGVYKNALSSVTTSDSKISYSNATKSGKGGSVSYTASSQTITGANTDTSGATDTKVLKFSDVGENHWAYDFIYALAKRGIVTGMSDTEFQPDRAVRREEFIKLIISALPLKNEIKTDSTSVFFDIPKDSYFVPYVMKAYEAKLISGTGEGIFGYGAEIKRQDAAVILNNVASYYKLEKSTMQEISYADRETIDDYALEAVSSIAGLGLFKGDSDNCLNPQKGITRAEACAVITRLISLTEATGEGR